MVETLSSKEGSSSAAGNLKAVPADHEWVRAAREVLGLAMGESSEDGQFFLREFECLGACCNAPTSG